MYAPYVWHWPGKGRKVSTPAFKMPWTTAHELRHARQTAHLEQKELAALLEPPVVEKTISRWENGRGEPSISQWRQIARICHAPWLLSDDDGRGVTQSASVALVTEGQLILLDELPPCRNAATLTAVK